MAGQVRLIRSVISIAGMVLTTISAVLFVVVLLADVFGLHTSPYAGIVFFLILPTLFVIGLLLIPLGAWIERRREAAGKAPAAREWPRIDLNNPTQRTTAVVIFALTIVNIVIVSLAAYKGVEYMETTSFCGQVCHTPMRPQFVAHQLGPHAGVACATCHVGAGARGFVKSKMSGTRQLVSVGAGTFPRPIIAAAADLAASHETCEGCHSPDRYQGEVTVQNVEHADDEANTPSVSTLRMHVGGRDGTGRSAGIHWHADPSTVIEYIATDERHQTIPWVRVTDRRGVREYAVAGANPNAGVRRRMECADCHNRPGHPIAQSAERAVDRAITRGEIDRMLPFVRREAVKALKAEHGSEESAVATIAKSMREFYQSSAEPATDGHAAALDRAVLAVQNIYRRSVFPDMKVTFGTYPSNIGHIDAPGCFRCHDDEHVTPDGKAIGQDCETCHAIE